MVPTLTFKKLQLTRVATTNVKNLLQEHVSGVKMNTKFIWINVIDITATSNFNALILATSTALNMVDMITQTDANKHV